VQLKLREDAVGPTQFTVHTDVFEGPLDLLLYLVRRDGVDLMDLQVAVVADAYLSFLGQMDALDLSLAGDWLLMAATLIHLKSLELLPRPPTWVDDDDAEDPRERLARQLRDHEALKLRALVIGSLDRVGEQVAVRAPANADDDGRPVDAGLDAFGLLDVFFGLLKRASAPEPVHTLAEGGPDIGTLCRHILAALPRAGSVADLANLLEVLPTIGERVVTFIGVLEMTRLGWLDVTQDAHLAVVRVERMAEEGTIDLAVLLGLETPAPGEDDQMALPL